MGEQAEITLDGLVTQQAFEAEQRRIDERHENHIRIEAQARLEADAANARKIEEVETNAKASVDAAKDVNVEVVGRRLVISGERRDERDESDANGGQRLREFRYGSFRREFGLGAQVKPEDVSASYDAGVLTVRVKGAYSETKGQRIAVSTGAPAAGNDEPAKDGEA